MLDNKSAFCYNSGMIRKRKPRSDRTHLIYQITNTVTGETYIGITVRTRASVRLTLRRRIQKHVQRALAETKGWALCESIRTHGTEAFVFAHLETVRGKRAAHQREVELLDLYQPALNTAVKQA